MSDDKKLGDTKTLHESWFSEEWERFILNSEDIDKPWLSDEEYKKIVLRDKRRRERAREALKLKLEKRKEDNNVWS